RKRGFHKSSCEELSRWRSGKRTFISGKRTFIGMAFRRAGISVSTHKCGRVANLPSFRKAYCRRRCDQTDESENGAVSR
ncbi:MAG: hypothetical protein WA858_17625, partial [Xanthobacteraceae bacterium]